MAEEIGPIAIVGAGPNEKDLDTGPVPALRQSNDIGVWQIGQIDVLIGLNAGERPYPVAPDGGGLKFKRLGGVMHALCIFALYLGRAAR